MKPGNEKTLMKTSLASLIATALLAKAFSCSLSAATLCVSLESTNPVAPFATWETAARVIQDAVDAAKAGDTVLVTNGVYAVGSRDAGDGANRVVVTNAITLLSVNGPVATTVDGGGSVRCVYLGANAMLSGFTLTKGTGQGACGGAGGGALCEASSVVSNSVIIGNGAGWGGGGGVAGGTFFNCTLTGNAAPFGGGASGSTLNNCTLTGNSAGWGGAASGSTLYHCTLTGNNSPTLGSMAVVGKRHITAEDCGGRHPKCGCACNPDGSVASGCSLYNSTLRANGGGSNGSFYNCTVADNQGGILGNLYNCILMGNVGGSDGTFYNCTVLDNDGGISGTAFNSIIYYNSGGNYAEGATLNYCCTSPLPTNGIGNIAGPPLLMDMAAGDFRLREDSPCIDAGTNLVGLIIVPFYNPNTGETSLVPYTYEPTDILGNTRFMDGNGDGTVAWDIGAYEFNSFRAPRFSVHPQLTAGGWRLNVTGAPDKWVHLQRSGNLKDWEDIWSGFLGAEGAQQVNDSDMERKVMFYRAVVP